MHRPHLEKSVLVEGCNTNLYRLYLRVNLHAPPEIRVQKLKSRKQKSRKSETYRKAIKIADMYQ